MHLVMMLRSFSKHRSLRTIATLCLFFFLAESVSAQSVEELKANVDNLQAKINALDKEIAEYNKKITQTQGESKTLKKALADLALRRTKLLTEITATNLKIESTQKSITITEDKISVTARSIERNEDALSELIRRMNTNNEQDSLLIKLSLGAVHRLSDMVNDMKDSEDVSSQIKNKVTDLKIAKEDLSNSKIEFVAQKNSLLQLHSTLTEKQDLILQTTKEKETLLEQTKNKESAYQALLADQKKKKGELEKEVLDYEAKISQAVDVSKLPKYGKGVLQYPLEKITITQYFGNTPFSSQNPQVYNGSGHNGVDFSAPIGTPIYAAAQGTVIGIGNTDSACSGVSYGKFVLIRHLNGLTTLYAHLSVISVQQGQSVTSRQQIGLSGNTGYSTGPHLHFTVYASDSVHMTGPTEYKSKVCGTYMILPVAPKAGYLNPLSYF